MTPEEAIAQSINDLSDALDPTYGEDAVEGENPSREAVQDARDRLVWLLERGDLDVDLTADATNSLGVDITRGTGTRDQEKWKIRGSGASATEAREELKENLDALMEDLGAEVRDFQPDQELAYEE